jgi:cytoskeletal protein CcmA (bactofilin family)
MAELPYVTNGSSLLSYARATSHGFYYMKLPSLRGQGRRVLDGVQRFTTLIGHETRLFGRIEGGDHYIINGAVEGDCVIDAVIVLSEQCRWTGNIEAASAVVAGEVRGDILCRERLELTATARVSGRIASPAIAIEEGAIHQGEIRMARAGDIVRFRNRRQGDRAPGDAAE